MESEFDFPPDEGAFSSSEFKEEGADFTADDAGRSDDAGAYHSAAGASNARGKFEGYNDPSKQFSGHTRSYHQDARYEQSSSPLHCPEYE